MIRTIELSKRYGTTQALDRVNLSFKEGKTTGIIGENGAGKTTLFRCIAGLESFDGQITSDKEPLKNHLGFLPPELFFFNRMTAREYIQLLCVARGLKKVPIDDKNLFDLPLDKYASAFSTGMKKKLALTAILLQPNDYFILDEPYNGIDLQGSLMLTEIIHKLKSLNKTVIISSHILSTMTDICDKIHLFKEGRLINSFTRDQFDRLNIEMTDTALDRKIAGILDPERV